MREENREGQKADCEQDLRGHLCGEAHSTEVGSVTLREGLTLCDAVALWFIKSNGIYTQKQYIPHTHHYMHTHLNVDR